MEDLNPIHESQIPPSVSYRQLAAMLSLAPAEPASADPAASSLSAERQAFEVLLAQWSRSGQQLLRALAQGGPVVAEGRAPRQLMALGALQAHLAMALQAHAAATGAQPE
jgi:hypothetical protein